MSIFCRFSNKAQTLSLESKFNYNVVALSPDGALLLAVNEQGEAQLISMVSCTVIHRHKFQKEVQCAQFSPDGRHFAVAKDNSGKSGMQSDSEPSRDNSCVQFSFFVARGKSLASTTLLCWNDTSTGLMTTLSGWSGRATPGFWLLRRGMVPPKSAGSDTITTSGHTCSGVTLTQSLDASSRRTACT